MIVVYIPKDFIKLLYPQESIFCYVIKMKMYFSNNYIRFYNFNIIFFIGLLCLLGLFVDRKISFMYNNNLYQLGRIS